MDRASLFLFGILVGTLGCSLPALPASKTAASEGMPVETAIARQTQAAVDTTALSCAPDVVSEQALVNEVIDGDTIEVVLNGQTLRVRYIGIDTPERDEYFYHQATLANQSFVAGKTVMLFKDVSDTDRYGRLLRYVFVDTIFVNYELVRQGYALASTYPPDVACAEAFAEAQRLARSEQAGFWSPLNLTGQFENTSNCHPSYPTVCIAASPPDLDCKDVPHRNFIVLGEDPHRFDGDNDGIGCEK